MTLPIGTILTSKTDSSVKRKVLGICGEVVFLSQDRENSMDYYSQTKSLKGVEEEYTYPKEQWRPEFGSSFWRVTSSGHVVEKKWMDDNVDTFSLYIENCNPTKESALAYKEKMVKLLAGIND